jgi:hypothetical protein
MRRRVADGGSKKGAKNCGSSSSELQHAIAEPDHRRVIGIERLAHGGLSGGPLIMSVAAHFLQRERVVVGQFEPAIEGFLEVWRRGGRTGVLAVELLCAHLFVAGIGGRILHVERLLLRERQIEEIFRDTKGRIDERGIDAVILDGEEADRAAGDVDLARDAFV